MRPVYIVVIDAKILDNAVKKKKKPVETTQAINKQKQRLINAEDDITDSELDEDTENDVELDIDNADFITLDYDMGDLPTETEPAFYTIMSRLPANRDRLVAVLYVEKRGGRDALITYLNDEKNHYKTIKNNVWMISLQDIRDYISSCYSTIEVEK